MMLVTRLVTHIAGALAGCILNLIFPYSILGPVVLDGYYKNDEIKQVISG